MPAKDLYVNKGYGSATESAAGVLTFSEIRTNVSIFEKVAWVIQRVEWYLNQATYGLMLDGSDHIEIAMVASSAIASLGLEMPAVIDLLDIQRVQATNVGFNFQLMPIIRDFSNLPGGGLIIAPRPLFVAIEGISLATPASVECRFYFTQKVLKADEYLELIDFYRIVQ